MASCESHQVSARYFSILVLFRVPSCNKAVPLSNALVLFLSVGAFI